MEKNEMEIEAEEIEETTQAGKFQLYCGLVKNGVWYNYATLEKIKGGILTILDGADDSIPSRLMNITKGCVKTLYTADGEEITLNSSDYFNLTMVDAKLISRKYANYVTDGKHIFTEYFRCPRCSDISGETFKEVSENWNDLIKSDDMSEKFAESQDDLIFETNLPNGIVIEGNKGLQGGTFTKLFRKNITIADAIDVANDTNAMQSLANKMCAIWDKQIVKIDGMNDITFKTYCKRKGVSITKKYLVDQDDIEEMYDDSPLGLDVQNRVVRCNKCSLDIGSDIDETNFFSVFFQSKKRDQGNKARF